MLLIFVPNLPLIFFLLNIPQIEPEETPLNTKHAVRCCKDDSPIIDIDAELWSQKKASCPFTMKQLWTGESQEVTSQDTFLGYTLYSNRKCDGSNTVIGNEKSPFSPAQCRDLCNEDSSCVSFEYQRESSICILSSSCNHYDLTKTHQKFNWYFKHWSVLPPGYTKYEHRKCDGGTSFQTRTTQECANKCSVDRECASFSMNLETQSCNLSSICTHYAETTEDTTSSFNWYLKQDDDDKENEECPFLTYDKAKVSILQAQCACKSYHVNDSHTLCLSRNTVRMQVVVCALKMRLKMVVLNSPGVALTRHLFGQSQKHLQRFVPLQVTTVVGSLSLHLKHCMKVEIQACLRQAILCAKIRVRLPSLTFSILNSQQVLLRM